MKETVYKVSAPISFSIALIADTHNSDPSAIIASLRKNTPDLVAITGDILVGHRPESDKKLIVEEQENVRSLISGCAAIAPTFISLGNHEWMISQEDVETLELTGAVVLDNRYVTQTVNGKRLWIGGLTSAIVTDFQKFREKEGGRYPYRPRHAHRVNLDTDSAWLDEFEKQDGYKVLLCHHPEYWSLREPYLSRRTIDLVLSGHAHGGQIRLFGRGFYAPGQGWMPEFTSGVYDGRLIVSRGLSNTASVPRLFNEPEIVYVEVEEDEYSDRGIY